MKYLMIMMAAIGLSISAQAQEYQRRTFTENNSKIESSRLDEVNGNTIIKGTPDTNNGYSKQDRRETLLVSSGAPETDMEGAVPVNQDFNNVCLIPAIKDFEMSNRQNYCPQHVEGPRDNPYTKNRSNIY
ncbi:MAG: hypothetical protein ACJ75J_05960 [Cytophagaceae bacterium]